MGDIYSEKPWLKNYDKKVPPTLKYGDKTFAEKFREVVEKYPNKTALIYMARSSPTATSMSYPTSSPVFHQDRPQAG